MHILACAGMLDIKLVREKPEAVRENIARRHDPSKLELLEKVIREDARWRELTTRINHLRRRRNEASLEVGRLLREGKDASSLREEAEEINRLIEEAEEERRITFCPPTDLSIVQQHMS